MIISGVCNFAYASITNAHTNIKMLQTCKIKRCWMHAGWMIKVALKRLTWYF